MCISSSGMSGSARAELEEKAKSDRQQKHQATYDISEYERMSLDVPEEA